VQDEFVENPADIVKAGDEVQVRVMSVDLENSKISLSMKSVRCLPSRIPMPYPLVSYRV
jgi:ribosomal protein S1